MEIRDEDKSALALARGPYTITGVLVCIRTNGQRESEVNTGSPTDTVNDPESG